MAKNQEILEINLRKNTNVSSRGYGKYYGFVEFKGTLTTRALAEHIASHGSLWTRDLVEGVLNQLKVCLPEKVCQGYGVQLDGIGTLYPTVGNKPGGLASIANFTNVADIIDGIHMRFTPELKELDRKTAAQFAKQVSMQQKNYVVPIYETVGGKKTRVRTAKMPIGDWISQGCPDLA